MRKTIIWGCILGLILVGGSLFASERGAFPPIGLGARPLAMGGAFVAVADNADAVYWNPAGLSQLFERQINTMQTSPFGMEINYQWLAMAQPIGSFVLGMGYNGLDASQAFGDFPYMEKSYLFSLAGTEFVAGQRLLWGVSAKYNTMVGGSDLINTNERGVGVDAGILWQKFPFSVGVVARDLYTKLSGTLTEDGLEEKVETKLAADLAFGVAYRAGKATWALDFSEIGRATKPHVGVEYQVNEAVKIRGGYNQGSITAGLGIKTGNWLMDYAYNTHLAGDAQRFSVGIRF